MIKPKTFRKLPECDTCLFYSGNLMTPCPIHPRGVSQSHCLDYREDQTAVTNWQQFLGTAWEDGALGHGDDASESPEN